MLRLLSLRTLPTMAAFFAKPVPEWGVQDVQDFLSSLDMHASVAQRFAVNAVNGADLLALSNGGVLGWVGGRPHADALRSLALPTGTSACHKCQASKQPLQTSLGQTRWARS